MAIALAYQPLYRQRFLILITAMLALFSCGGSPKQSARQVSELQYRQFFASGARPEGDYTLAFLSDRSLAVLMGTGVCRLTLFDLDDDRLTRVAETATCGAFERVTAAGAGHVLVSYPSEAELYSADLKEERRFALHSVVPSSFPGNRIVGDYLPDGWTAYSMLPAWQAVRSGPGRLESISNDRVVFRKASRIVTQSIDGGELGSFEVQAKSPNRAEIAGKNQLLWWGAEDRIVDYSGETIAKLPHPGGWGAQHGWSAEGGRWSAEGGRLLYDNFTRRVPVLQRAGELLLGMATLGLGAVNEIPNGEVVRVVNTTNGKVCFELDSPHQLLGREGGYHADISPSGRLVAILFPDRIRLYELPATCAFRVDN